MNTILRRVFACLLLALLRGPVAASGASPGSDRLAYATLVVKDDVADTYRRLGFAGVAAAPAAGVLRGSGAVVSLAERRRQPRPDGQAEAPLR